MAVLIYNGFAFVTPMSEMSEELREHNKRIEQERIKSEVTFTRIVLFEKQSNIKLFGTFK